MPLSWMRYIIQGTQMETENGREGTREPETLNIYLFEIQVKY